MLDLSSVDVERVLNEFGVPFKPEGENISNKCVGVCCPFCGDDNYHLGVFKNNKNFSCWICGETGSLYRLVSYMTGVGWFGFMDQLASCRIVDRGAGAIRRKRMQRRRNAKDDSQDRSIYDKYPNGCIKVNEKWHRRTGLLKKFMERRRLDLARCTKFGAAFSMTGKASHRFVMPLCDAPVMESSGAPLDRMISWQARAMRGDMNPPYMFPSDSCHADTLYVLGDCTGDMILVEGVFDAWRVGDGAAASYSAHLTEAQESLICDIIKPVRLIIAWDPDAYDKAVYVGKNLAPFIDTVQVAKLPTGEDPDSLGRYRMMEIVGQAKTM